MPPSDKWPDSKQPNTSKGSNNNNNENINNDAVTEKKINLTSMNPIKLKPKIHVSITTPKTVENFTIETNSYRKIKTVYKTPEDARKEFISLLKDKNIGINDTFGSSLNKIVHDTRYKSVTKLDKKKEIFNQYVIDLRKNMEKNKHHKLEQTKERFKKLLQECKSIESSMTVREVFIELGKIDKKLKTVGLNNDTYFGLDTKDLDIIIVNYLQNMVDMEIKNEKKLKHKIKKDRHRDKHKRKRDNKSKKRSKRHRSRSRSRSRSESRSERKKKRIKLLTLYVTGLNNNTKWKELRQFGLKGGKSLFNCELYKNGDDLEGLIQYTDKKDFEYAIKHLNNKYVHSFKVKIHKTKPKKRSKGKFRDHMKRKYKRSLARETSISTKHNHINRKDSLNGSKQSSSNKTIIANGDNNISISIINDSVIERKYPSNSQPKLIQYLTFKYDIQNISDDDKNTNEIFYAHKNKRLNSYPRENCPILQVKTNEVIQKIPNTLQQFKDKAKLYSTTFDKDQFIDLLNELSYDTETPQFHSKTKWDQIMKLKEFTNDNRFKCCIEDKKSLNRAKELFEEFCWKINDDIEDIRLKIKRVFKSQNYIVDTAIDTPITLYNKFKDASRIKNEPKSHILLALKEIIAKQIYFTNHHKKYRSSKRASNDKAKYPTKKVCIYSCMNINLH